MTADTCDAAQIRRNTMALAWCRLIAAFGLVLGGLGFWLGSPPAGTFEGLVLMALATIVGSK